MRGGSASRTTTEHLQRPPDRLDSWNLEPAGGGGANDGAVDRVVLEGAAGGEVVCHRREVGDHRLGASHGGIDVVLDELRPAELRGGDDLLHEGHGERPTRGTPQ